MANKLTEEQIAEALAQGLTVYNKICKNPKCNCEFKSLSRNQKYCSDECGEKMKVVVKAKSKVRAKKRKEYSENQEINRALSKSYSLCETIFELYRIPKVCALAGVEGHVCNGPLERNHKNLNPFDNSPWNLEYRCKSAHKAFHDTQGDVNMVQTYSEAIDEAGFEDDDKKSVVMIQYTERKIREARK